MDRQNRIKNLLSDALELDPSERAVFLARQASDDHSIASEVQALISAHEQADGFLDDPTLILRDDLAPAEPRGTVIGRYEILRLLGEGGFGTVYLAEQREPVRREVALKLIKPGMDTQHVMARFEAERQTLAMMKHPGIAAVFDAGATASGHPYFVMEYVDGVPITNYCDGHSLSVEKRLSLFIETCHAVQHAHAKGVIHRDLKPSNLLIAEHDGVPQVKIIDFGVAKAMHGQLTDHALTADGPRIIGTPHYMSPEQAGADSADIDTRADVYSLGAVLYELLAGATPFDDQRFRRLPIGEVHRIIRDEDPPKPSTRASTHESCDHVAAERAIDPRRLSSRLSGDLDWITLKAMEKDRDRRYGSAAELAQDVRRHLEHEPVIASPPSALYSLKKFSRRNRAAVIAAMVVVAVFIAGFSVTSMSLMRARRDAATARQTALFMQEMLGGIDPSVARGKDSSLLQSILRQTATRIHTDLAGQPVVEASIRDTIGRVHMSLGDYDAAMVHLKAAFELRKKELGENNPATLDSQAVLGLLLTKQGKLADAEAMSRDALNRRKAVLGNNDPATLTSMAELGNVLAMRGKSKESEPWCLDALSGRRALLGNDHPDTLNSINDVGALRMDQGRYADAATLFRESLERSRVVLGGDHPRTLVAMSNLARALRAAGNLDEAATLMRETLDVSRRVLGPNHPDTLSALNSIGSMLIAQGRPAEAQRCFEEVLEARRTTLGDDHPDTLVAINNLGLSLRQQGKNAEAEKYYEEALNRNRATLGELHPNTLRSKHNMAVVLREEGRFAEAATFFREALEGRRQALGEAHPDTIVTMMSLAKLLLNENDAVHDPQQALQLALAAADAPENAQHLECLATVAEAYFQTGNVSKAIEVVDAAIEASGEDSPQRTELALALARYRAAPAPQQ